jgi:hypothetical protein
MSYVKYREDDVKIIEHRCFLQHGSDFPAPKREPIRYFDCKYCHEIFTDHEKLYLHIKDKHHIIGPLVVINGKVATDKYVVHHIDSAHIDLFEYRAPILINGKSIPYSPGDKMIDITKMLCQALSATSSCSITFQSISVEIEMVTISVDDIDLIDSTIEKWESEINTGMHLSTDYLDRSNGGNRLFLQGMYDYYVACQAKKDKAKRYDDAWAILSRFDHLLGVGNCVLRTIAYRRNWILSLQSLDDGGTDDFSIANDYYQHRPSDLANTPSGKQLYVEDSTKMSLDLVTLFQEGEYDELRARMSQLPDFDLINDINLIDQLNLLSARLEVVDGNRRKVCME